MKGKKILILAVISLLVMLTACSIFITSSLEGIWFDVDYENEIEFNSDSTFTLYDSAGDTVATGDNYYIEDGMLMFNLTEMLDIVSGEVEPITGTYCFGSTYELKTTEELAFIPPHPLFFFSGMIYKGGDIDTLEGEWKSNTKLIETEGSSDVTRLSTYEYEFNSDGTYFYNENDDGATDSHSGTYVADKTNKEITLTPSGDSDIVLSYEVFGNALILSQYGSDNFSKIKFEKDF